MSLAPDESLVDDPALRVLADPVRARIVELLAGEQLCTCHLVELTGAKQTNVSNHLRVLREAGLVAGEPCGRYTYYRLEAGVVDSLARALGRLARTAADAPKRPCP